MTGLLSNGASRKSMDGDEQHDDEPVRDAAVGTDDEATIELLNEQQERRKQQENATKPKATMEATK